MKTTDKPTLSDLFESKKLDVPSDQFWDDFQEQVKVRALTTVVQRRSPSPFAKLLFFSVPSFCACALVVFLLFRGAPSPAPSSVPVVNALTEATDSDFLEEFSDQEVVLASPDLADSELPDQNLYVHQTLSWTEEDSSFEEHTLKESEISRESLSAQFTF